MSLPDTGFIAGRAAKFAFSQRVSLTSFFANGAGGSASVPASGFSALTLATALLLPIATGQGIQIRDAFAWVGDDSSSNKLICQSMSLVLLAPGAGQVITSRGVYTSGNNPNVIAGGPGNNGPSFGTTDWPFITWSDFPIFQTLQPNLRFQVNVMVQNTDGALAHQIDLSAGVLYEVYTTVPVTPRQPILNESQVAGAVPTNLLR